MKTHHYTECGLQNVFIDGIPVVTDDDGDQVIRIPAVNELHKVIALGIVCHKFGMSGAELRFLRTEMGYSQVELATLLQIDKQTIGRWEREEFSIDGTAEILIRKLAIEKLELPGRGEFASLTIESLARSISPSNKIQEIKLRISDCNDDYILEAA